MLEKKIKTFDIILFMVCSILGIDTIGTSAAIGVSSITWWVLSIFLFFLPYGFISAELGSTFPGDGGIYLWVKDAFGELSGMLVSWFYWINVAFWMPSLCVMFSGIFTKTFIQDSSNIIQAAIAIALLWITVLISIMDVSVSKWIPNIGAIIKISLLLLIGISGITFGISHGFANEFTLSNLKISSSSTISYVSVIVFNFMGFELISSLGDKIENPKKNIPKATILSGIIISIVYIFATFGLLSALPQKDINIVTGITDALKIMVVNLLGENFIWLFNIICVIILLTFVSNMVTWSIGSNNVIAETGLDKRAPFIFGHKHERYGTPDYALYIMGIVGTLLIVGNYASNTGIANIFWTMFSLSSIIFLLPYLLFFPAVIVLRRKFPNVKRPYMVPGGKVGLYICSILGEAFILLAVVFFFVPPEGTDNILKYEISLTSMVVLTFIVGILIYLRGKYKVKSMKLNELNIK